MTANDPLTHLLGSIPAGAGVIHIGAGTGNRLPAPAGAVIKVGRQAALAPTPFPDAQFAVVNGLFDQIPLGEAETVLQKLIAARVSRILLMITLSPEGTGPLTTLLRRCRAGLLPGRARQGETVLPGEGDLRALFRRLNLTVTAETTIAAGKDGRTVVLDASIPPLPAITLVQRCVVRGDECEIDGKRYPVHRGCWACYVPDLGFKFLYGIGGQLHCTHGSAPDRAALFAGTASIRGSSYTSADWLAAFSRKVTRRAAENYVAASRLASAGIGPAVHGCVAVREFVFDDSIAPCGSAGIRIDNLAGYGKKRDTTEREMLRAGVEPDRIRSSLRQQIRGYVSDLNSVVGVMPVNADGEISRLETALDTALLSSE